MSRRDRPEKLSLVVGISVCLICAISFFVIDFSQTRAQDETSWENTQQPQTGLAPAELNVYRLDLQMRNISSGGAKQFRRRNDQSVSLLRSSKKGLASSFYKHFVPTELSVTPALTVGQGPELDYSTFKHTSQRHAAIACTSCHQREDNLAKPTFPGHSSCINCHGNQFFTPSSPMCLICHSDVNTAKAPLKSFPASFKERFNMKFDHAQHMTVAVRPKNGCGACHTPGANRGAALSIPATINAHDQCYVCHTPSSKSAGGRDLASCGVCHDQKSYTRTATNSPAFRASFSHAKHGPRQRLDCVACHSLTAGLAQGRQVSSPRTAEHFSTGSSQSCLSCHNGKRSFGGDLAFKDCRRCHTGPTFRMPT